MDKQRKYLRFDADKNTLAGISFGKKVKDFTPEIIGLVFNEAYRGCGVIIVYNDKLEKNMECIVQCGRLDPVLAKIAWINRLDTNTLKLGIEYRI